MFVDVFESGHVAGFKAGDILEAVDDALTGLPPPCLYFGIGQKDKLLVRHLSENGKNELIIDVPMRKVNKQRPPIVEPKSPIHSVIAPKIGLLKIPHFSGAMGMGFGGFDRSLWSLATAVQFKRRTTMYYYVTVSHLPEGREVHLAESQSPAEMKELAEMISRNALPEINWVKVEDDQNRLMFYWDAKAAVVAHKNPYKRPPKAPEPGPPKW